MTNLARMSGLFLGFAPIITLEQSYKNYVWETFHEDLINRGESLGRVINALQYLLDTVDRPEIPSGNHCKFFSQGKDITNLDLSGKFSDYFKMQIYEQGLNPEARDRYSRNLAANLVRGLKMMKNNEPVFQLPEQDKRDLVVH